MTSIESSALAERLRILESRIDGLCRGEVHRIRIENYRNRIPGYEQLEVWPEYLAPFARERDSQNRLVA